MDAKEVLVSLMDTNLAWWEWPVFVVRDLDCRNIPWVLTFELTGCALLSRPLERRVSRAPC